MKVKRNTLLLLACLVWSAAGFNILRIGISVYPAYISLVNIILSGLVFAVFQKLFLENLVTNTSERTAAIKPKSNFFSSFSM